MSWFSETSWLALVMVGKALGKLSPQAPANILPKRRTRPDKRTRATKQLKVYIDKYREDNKKRKEKFLASEKAAEKSTEGTTTDVTRDDYQDWWY